MPRGSPAPNLNTFQRMVQAFDSSWSYFTSRSYLARLRSPGQTDDELSALLSTQGEVSGIVLAQSILERYNALDEAAKKSFLEHLASDFGLDVADVAEASQHYLSDASAANYKRLIEASEPPRQELLRRLNTAPGGTLTLVRMREDLLRLKGDERLAMLDLDFIHLFSSWFNRGFLSVKRVDWSSPAELLERIIRYEAVHSISDWDDLRQRVSAADRACYAFFHPVLEDEPLIFIEVALTKAVPGSVQDLLARDRAPIDPQEAKTAVFYSISNCQPGLRGISFGAFLIKQVLQEMSQNYPKLNTWVTLSPVPGFANWLSKQDERGKVGELYAKLETVLELPLEARGDYLKTYDESLSKAALRYFTEAKHRSGTPYDPVARFHLNNGARLLDIHTRADVSDKGLKEALGLMVNYQYEPKKMLQHHEAYAAEQRVVLAKNLEKQAK